MLAREKSMSDGAALPDLVFIVNPAAGAGKTKEDWVKFTKILKRFVTGNGGRGVGVRSCRSASVLSLPAWLYACVPVCLAELLETRGTDWPAILINPTPPTQHPKPGWDIMGS